MRWSEIRTTYPEQWLVIEALEAHTDNDQRILDRMSVVETCRDGSAAMERYRQLHQVFPLREFYFIHTSRETLDIHERHWLGVRRQRATSTAWPKYTHNSCERGQETGSSDICRLI